MYSIIRLLFPIIFACILLFGFWFLLDVPTLAVIAKAPLSPASLPLMAPTEILTVCSSCPSASYQSIQSAIDAASDGALIKIAEGVYTNTGSAVVTVTKNLTLLGGYSTSDWETSNPQSYPTILDGEGQRAVLQATTSDITVNVSGLILQYGRDYNVYMILSRLVMTDSAVLSSTLGSGIFLDDCDYSIIQDNLISGHAMNGIHFERRNEILTISGNTIKNNSQNGIIIYGDNHYLTFENNLIVDNQQRGFYVPSGSGNQYLTLRRNTIAQNSSDGIYILNSINHTLDNNIMAENGGDGIEWQHGNGTLRHNTIANNQSGSGLYAPNAVSLTLLNTIIANHTTGINTSDVNANIQADRTLWYNNTANTNASSGTITNTNGLTGDPDFVGGSDPFTAYHIGSNSAAIDAATLTNLSTDIDGQTRPANGLGLGNDIGADEFAYMLILTPSYQKQSANPNTVANYTLELQNSGGVTNTLELSYTNSMNWASEFIPNSVELASGAAISITFVLTVPADGSGILTTLITATSSISPAIQSTAQLKTLIGVGVDFEPNYNQSLLPGESITYTHTLTNTGATTDTFSLTALSSQGWATLQTASPLTVGAGLTTSVQVRVDVPPTAISGIIESTILTATSNTLSEAFDTVQNQTTVSLTSGTRYVAVSGSNTDNNCLVASEPCLEVGYAASQAQAGDLIKVAAGTYTNPSISSSIPLVSISKDLTIVGGYSTSDWNTSDPENHVTILDGEGKGRVMQAVGTVSNNFVLNLSGLTIQHGTDYGMYMELSRLTMSNSAVLSSTLGSGIFLDDCDNSIIQDNLISGNAMNGIHFERRNEILTISGNTIKNNSQNGIIIYGDNHYLTFENNLIVDNQQRGFYVPSGSGNQYLTLRRNTIAQNSSDGIYILNSINHTLDNNIMAENGGDGIEWQYGNGTLRHNTIANNQSGSGLYASNAVSLTLLNTIIANHTTGIKTSHASATVNANKTLWYGNSTLNDSSAGGTININNNVFGDPVFIGGSDPFYAYHIDSISPAINAGVNAGVTNDIDGDLRPLFSDYDIGADESQTITLPSTSVTINGPTNGFIQNSYTFTATVSPVTATVPLTYVWQATNQSPITQTNNLSDSVSFTWNSVGTQLITVTTSNAHSSQTTTAGIIIVDQPITGLTASNDSPTALGNNTTLTATISTGTNVSYSWDFGDGENGSGAIVTHDYGAVGSYIATVTAINTEGSRTTTTSVEIIDEAITGLTASNDSPTVLGNNTTFNATTTAGTNISYSWNFGDGATGSGAIATHTYSAVGSYTVTVTATNSVSQRNSTTSVDVEEFSVTINLNNGELTLTWAHLNYNNGNPITVDEYQVWRSTSPYFTPGDADSSQISSLTPPFTRPTITYTDTTAAINDAGSNHYYLIRAVGNGNVLAESNQVGEYDFNAETGYNLIALTLIPNDVTDADTLGAYIGPSVSAILKYDASRQTFDLRVPDTFGTNFPIEGGEAIFIQLNNNAPTTINLIGQLPSPLSFTLVPGDGSGDKYNFLSLPLSHSTITADQMATEIGGVTALLKYDATRQAFDIRVPSRFGTNFSIQPGEAFVVVLNQSAPSTWP